MVASHSPNYFSENRPPVRDTDLSKGGLCLCVFLPLIPFAVPFNISLRTDPNLFDSLAASRTAIGSTKIQTLRTIGTEFSSGDCEFGEKSLPIFTDFYRFSYENEEGRGKDSDQVEKWWIWKIEEDEGGG